MKPDPYVRTVGQVTDIDGRLLKVGVDYDSITIGYGGMAGAARLYNGQVAGLAHILALAIWEAAQNSLHMGSAAEG